MRKRGVSWKFVLVVLLAVSFVLPGRVLVDTPFSLHLPSVFGESGLGGEITTDPEQIIPDIQGMTQYRQDDEI